MQEFFYQTIDQALRSIPTILTAILILIVSLYVARLLGNLIRKALERRAISPSITHLLSQILSWTIITFGIITALQQFFNVTAFLAGLGIIGFTVGFALQDIMKNFAAGVILVIQRPFKEGDTINVSGFDGTILVINLRTTEMKTLDGRIVILPNADVLSHAIVNYTRADRRRVELPISVGPDSDTEQVRAIILDSIQSVKGFVSEPAPLVAFHTLGTKSIDLTAYFWIDMTATTPPTAMDAALTKIKNAFKKQGVEMPHP
jgi:small conductance mechanosensitive channel